MVEYKKLDFIDEFKGKDLLFKKCEFKGKIVRVRNHKKLIFLDLLDHTGQIQVVLRSESTRNFKQALSLLPGSYVEVRGICSKGKNAFELVADSVKILSKPTLTISPHPWEINGLNKKYLENIFNFCGYYLSNPQRMAILKIKSDFIHSLHEYFQNKRFTLVEPPILTSRLLYENEKGVLAKLHNEKVYLSQCATFELEPLAMAFRKVYTISPAFRNEKGGSKRHLAEYTHVKAELLFTNLDDLMFLAGDAIYQAMKKTVRKNKKELDLIGAKIKIDKLKPENHCFITYDDAIKLVKKNGSETAYGEGLKKEDEKIITSHFDDRYAWVKFLPFKSEGFPYKRLPSHPHLSMTCDLIAPNGAGEMVGVAEKTTDIEEIIKNIIEKGKRESIKEYWEYILLRKCGIPPHGGIGAAPERILYGILNLDHIRFTKPWPRYPGKKINEKNKIDFNPWKNQEISKLIKKYRLK